MSRAARVFIVVLAVLLVAATARIVWHFSEPDSPAPVSTSGQSVAATADGLTLDGKLWWPIGINAYQLGTDWDLNTGCGAEVDLDAFFGALPPRSLIRTAFLSTMAVDADDDDLDFAALDRVVDAAHRHDQLLVVVLTGNDGACEDERPKERDWYAGGWKTEVPAGMPMSFADWLDTAVQRWAGAPSVVGWTAVGEPSPAVCGSPDCAWEQQTCPPDAGPVLREFQDTVGARIHELDPGTTVWGGRVGGGQCGSAEADYELVGESPDLDVLEYHAYDAGLALPGDPVNGLGRRIEQAQRIGKPLVVSEIGMPAGSCATLADRSSQMSDLIDRQRAAGTAGALFWAFVPDPRPAECTLDIGPHDPLIKLIGDAATE